MSSKNEITKHKIGSDKDKTGKSKDDTDFQLQSDRFRWSFEDPMHNYIKQQKIRDKEERVKELQSMLESSSSSSESADDRHSTGHRKQKRRRRSESGLSHRKNKHRSRSESSSSHRKNKHRSRSESSSSCKKHKRRKKDKLCKKEEHLSEEWIEKSFNDRCVETNSPRKRKEDYKQHKTKLCKSDNEDSRLDYHGDISSEHGVSKTEQQGNLDRIKKYGQSEKINKGKRKHKKSKHHHKSYKHS